MLSNQTNTPYQRPQAAVLSARLAEPRRFAQFVAGPRQVGKTTLVQQVLRDLTLPSLYVSADNTGGQDATWLEARWLEARDLARSNQGAGAVLVVDEVQKVHEWSEVVKRLWDEDSRHHLPLRVVLLGSAPLLMQRGLTESLAGRFETIHAGHWSFAEMRDAFGWDLETYIYYGGYPGAASFIDDGERWRRYVLDSLVETTIARDVLLMARIDKPALLRRLFELGCRYSAQVLSYTKMIGQLQDAGNTTTLAHYLELLAAAGMLRGLPKFAGDVARQRASSPKLQVFNTALMTAASGLSFAEARADHEFWGRLVESAVGAQLANAAAAGEFELFYWREGLREVDFVLRRGGTVVGIEVKSGRATVAQPGLTAFQAAFDVARVLLLGGPGMSLRSFFDGYEVLKS